LTTLPWERDPVLIVQVAGWAQDWYGRVWKISSPPGFDPQTIQPEVGLRSLEVFSSKLKIVMLGHHIYRV